MAVYSMTGYAGAASDAGAIPSVTVDLRSVNGRFLDLSLRLPDELRGLEPALRELVTSSCKRGKIELRVSTSRETDTGLQPPADGQLARLAEVQAMVQARLPQARALSVHEALGWCRGSGASELSDDTAIAVARRALAGLREARAREGERLATMLRERLARLRELSAQAAPLIGAVVQRQQARFLERWDEALSQALAKGPDGAPAAPEPGLRERAHERALAEAAAYAIRIDVAEELSRLSSHIEEIERLLAAGGELGKRLEFLIQELQREANTLGSKSVDTRTSQAAVELKVLIDQVREQIQNIE